jgi:transposase
MASLQQKKAGKYKYWQIVESRRVNGKPRPVVLMHLGTADALLRKLQGLSAPGRVKSYSHGTIAALLALAERFQIPALVNEHVASARPYMADKPVRNELTAGMTLVLGAIGMACMPTSKRGWWQWAKTTSLEYMLRRALGKVDSQHFWDLMDALPAEAIPRAEEALLQRVRRTHALEGETLYFDTTNFFTFIATTNERCTVAQRGKNKQKRSDLRQVGLAVVVTHKDHIPIFHLTYQGNRNDCKVFKELLGAVKTRMLAVGMDIARHTLVFDRGNNSKENMALVADADMHYVGALTPYHHKKLVSGAQDRFEPLTLDDGRQMEVCRTKTEIWGEERTVLVFVSDKLKAGQLRGVYKNLENKQEQLKKIQESLAKPAKAPVDTGRLKEKIETIAKGQFIKDIIQWSLDDTADGRPRLNYRIDQDKLGALGDKLGYRILMTDRHEWGTEKIIHAFYGQSFVEHAFKNMKNPYHLTFKPQHHWTDQKIRVHYFMGVLGYLMSTLLWKEAREKAGFQGTLDNLLDNLNNIRLAALVEAPAGPGKPKVHYQLEQMDALENALVQALGIAELHIKRPKIDEVSVYAKKTP